MPHNQIKHELLGKEQITKHCATVQKLYLENVKMKFWSPTQKVSLKAMSPVRGMKRYQNEKQPSILEHFSLENQPTNKQKNNKPFHFACVLLHLFLDITYWPRAVIDTEQLGWFFNALLILTVQLTYLHFLLILTPQYQLCFSCRF